MDRCSGILKYCAIALLWACSAPVAAGPDAAAADAPIAGDAKDTADSPQDLPAADVQDARAEIAVPDVTVADVDECLSSLEGPVVYGVVVDKGGLIIAKSPVLACTPTICLAALTDHLGRFAIGTTELPADFALKLPEDASELPHIAEWMHPVHFEGNGIVAVGALHRLELLPPLAMDGPKDVTQTFELGAGLALIARRTDLQIPLAAAHDDQLAVCAAPLDFAPPFLGLGSEKVIAVYSLSPFGTLSDTPIGVKWATKLPAGTQIKLRTIGQLSGILSPPMLATSDGTAATTAAGNGIVELSWLIVSL